MFGSIIDLVVEWGKKLYDWIIAPWVMAYDFLFGNTIWSAETISTVFDGIIDVLSKLGEIIVSVIVAPFQAAYDMVSGIAGLIFGIGEGEEVAPNVQQPVTEEATANVQAIQTATVAASTPPAETAPMTTGEEEVVGLNDVVAKLDQLLNALASGVDLKMDGAKYGEFLAKEGRR